MRPPKGLGQKWSLSEVVALVKVSMSCGTTNIKQDFKKSDL